MSLETLKNKVEGLSKTHQIEILRIITNHSNVSINENKSGVYINLSYIEPTVLEEMQKYLSFVEEQEQLLNPAESQKQDFKNIFFHPSNETQDENDMLTVYR